MKKSPSKFNVPNALTIIRMLSFPFFIYFILTDQYVLALAVLVMAWVTDGVDGAIARVFNQSTYLGSVLDPAADKMLMTSCYVTFSIKGLIPAWLGAIVISRDVILSFGVLQLVLLDSKVIAAPSILGKRTTLCQLFTVSIALLWAIPSHVSSVLLLSEASEDLMILLMPKALGFFFYLTAILTVLTLFQYNDMTFKQYDSGELRKVEG